MAENVGIKVELTLDEGNKRYGLHVYGHQYSGTRLFFEKLSLSLNTGFDHFDLLLNQ